MFCKTSVVNNKRKVRMKMRLRIFVLVLVFLIGALGTVSANNTREYENRTRIVVISDLHMGADPSFAEFNKNKDFLRNFLLQLKNSKDVAELVLAGDVLDQWFLPMNYDMPKTLSEFNDRVVKNNQEIVDSINSIIQEGKIRVTYVPGNHDLLFDAAEVDRIFPGINQARDTAGLGTYNPKPNIAIEHGHRYNFFCAPDPLSNANLTNGKSILPSGYFFTRIATSSVVEGKPKSNNAFPRITPANFDVTQMNYFEYSLVWKNILSTLPIAENFSDKVIKTSIDGFTQTYSVEDLLPHQGKDGKLSVNLYSGIVENWQYRQILNHVSVPIDVREAIKGAPVTDFTDQQAQTQYFDRDGSIRVVVFGHTHEAKIILSKNFRGNDVVYANSGTWIDTEPNAPTRTYVVIERNEGSANTTVGLYQYNEDGSSTLLKEAQLVEG